MVLPAVVETALSRYKRPVLTIKLREHKKTTYRTNIQFYMPYGVNLQLAGPLIFMLH